MKTIPNTRFLYSVHKHQRLCCVYLCIHVCVYITLMENKFVKIYYFLLMREYKLKEIYLKLTAPVYTSFWGIFVFLSVLRKNLSIFIQKSEQHCSCLLKFLLPAPSHSSLILAILSFTNRFSSIVKNERQMYRACEAVLYTQNSICFLDSKDKVANTLYVEQ